MCGVCFGGVNERFATSSNQRLHALTPFVAAVLIGTLGFCDAIRRTGQVAAPVLSEDVRPRTLSGRIISLESRQVGRRLLISVDRIDGFEKNETPARVRLTWRGKGGDFVAGDRVRLRAGLRPPPGPAAPHAFDFSRYLYFQKIGAVGYVVATPQILQADEEGWRARSSARVDRLRQRVAARIKEKAPGDGGAILAAITTGKRGAISDTADAALRDAGLAHLLAISGLHMGLVTTLVFLVVRAALALVEPVALFAPTKKIAAGVALLAGIAYLILSGGGWSAQRAFIMTSIMLAAILADRRALSLRNVAIAALFILTVTPEALLHPGFQMSFAAVTALVAAFETRWAQERWTKIISIRGRIAGYVGGLAATDLIASSATAPFAAFHFHRTAIYSLPANIAAGPIMGFWIMPGVILGALLLPFGLDGPAWRFSAAGVELVLNIANATASQRGAVAMTARIPNSAMVILTFGGLILVLTPTARRLLALIALPIAAALSVSIQSPVVFISREGENAAVIVRSPENGASVNAVVARKASFDLDVWRELVGAGELNVRSSSGAFDACDRLGCVATFENGQTIAFSIKPESLPTDCQRADLIVALYTIPREALDPCGVKVIDRRETRRSGAHALYLSDDYFRIETVQSVRGERPWSLVR
ncbi:MAG: ComEC/Rec2 family competence protein [Pseudomonadota bacterium]